MSLAELTQRWEHVRLGLLVTLEKFAPDELDFRPYPGAWSVRELILHVAQEEQGEFNHGLTQTLPAFPPAYDPTHYPDLPALQALLASIHAPNLAYLQGLPDSDLDRLVHTPWGAEATVRQMVEHLLEHEIHHRGELSLILGLLGRAGLDA